jgi:hypothetical protein
MEFVVVNILIRNLCCCWFIRRKSNTWNPSFPVTRLRHYTTRQAVIESIYVGSPEDRLLVLLGVGNLRRTPWNRKGVLGCSEDALLQVEQDPVPLNSVEGGPQMLLVLLE